MWITPSLWLVDAIFYILPPRSSSCLAMQLVKFVTLHIVLAWSVPESKEYRIKVNGNQYYIWLLIFLYDWQLYWFFCQQTLVRICVSTICMQRTMTMCSSLEMNLCRGKSCRRFAKKKIWDFCRSVVMSANPTSLFPPPPIIDAAKVQISEKGGWLCDPKRGQVGLSWFEVGCSEEPGGMIAD